MFTLISVNNKDSVGYRFIGVDASFYFDGEGFTFSSITSSRVKSISMDEDIMTVITKNTEYKFRKH